MPAIFIHVSDIHFGQERDERVHIHSDVKEQLIIDASEVVSTLEGGVAHGILATGDIAYSGVKEQYDAAGAWLDRLAEGVGCPIHSIQVIPGNHDVDRKKSSLGANHLLELIRNGGASEYEQVLQNDLDRTSLFARFEDFGRFSEGYDCGLDVYGRSSCNLRVELAPGRTIRFIRMNSSLLCTGSENDAEPELMVGHRQFIIEPTKGEEAVVLLHHPLNWYKDGDDANTYLRSRARVLITGHEHNPRVRVEKIEEGSDLLLLAAGATVPFKSDETYTFTYNVIEFDWDQGADALVITIHPRAWNPKRTCFEADDQRLGGKDPRFVLASPNFRKTVKPVAATEVGAFGEGSAGEEEPLVEIVAAPDSDKEPSVPPELEGYRLLLLRFFRDLSEGERLRLLVELGAFERDQEVRVTQALERQLFDWLVRDGKLAEIEKFIQNIRKNEEGTRK
ncbi:metallophosphoesterase [Brucella intermedia]|uniref:metallophosphoesterase n=1 Tax=Brucella intermedia TaxID=94625 RepID=UPI0034CD79D8